MLAALVAYPHVSRRSRLFNHIHGESKLELLLKLENKENILFYTKESRPRDFPVFI